MGMTKKEKIAKFNKAFAAGQEWTPRRRPSVHPQKVPPRKVDTKMTWKNRVQTKRCPLSTNICPHGCPPSGVVITPEWTPGPMDIR